MRDLDSVLNRAQRCGVSKIVNAGYDTETSQRAISMCRKYPWLMPAVGIHPNEAAEESIKKMDKISAMLDNDNVVAVGETGLDYYRDFSPRDAQRELFRMHITLARERGLPILIHTRNSLDDALDILKAEDYHRGIFHCYGGSYEQAKVVMDLGFYISFAGVLTFSRQARDVIKRLPLDRLLLETDAPFLAPLSHRGKRNEPAYIIETLHFAADILETQPEELEAILDANAREVFSC
ncbi:MAG: TatD family hydrolase [candidate division WOR-3 bacterium]|nr:MAG: TatD family hydrolase [candidate division WOR-3 bacterium]